MSNPRRASSIRALAQILNRSPGTIHGWLVRDDWRWPRRAPWTAQHVGEIRQWAEKRERPSSLSMQAAQLRKEKALADRAELQVMEMRRTLVDAREVARLWSGLVEQARRIVLEIPGKVAAQLAGLNAGEVQSALENEIRTALLALSNSSTPVTAPEGTRYESNPSIRT